MARRRKTAREVLGFLGELGVYAVLVVAYFFLVLHFLGDWLYHLYVERQVVYAVISLALIVGQGIVLEALTGALLKLRRRWFPG